MISVIEFLLITIAIIHCIVCFISHVLMLRMIVWMSCRGNWLYWFYCNRLLENSI